MPLLLSSPINPFIHYSLLQTFQHSSASNNTFYNPSFAMSTTSSSARHSHDITLNNEERVEMKAKTDQHRDIDNTTNTERAVNADTAREVRNKPSMANIPDLQRQINPFDPKDAGASE
jgi:hypothetical protein